jgi:predicted NAD/FAD-dependent oxidoreductase
MASSALPPQVIIAGAGVAGLTAAHRLLERGYDVTLIEANDFIGGKLGAHRDVGTDTDAEDAAKPAHCALCVDRGGCPRTSDWHEHCYHMYLNWYHNFWTLMDEIGALDSFLPITAVFNRARDAPQAPTTSLVNVGSPWSTWRNLTSGMDTPINMFLSGQAMADLTSEPAKRNDLLEKTSVASFMSARSYASEEALAATYRTTAQAFASPSYLSSARSFKALLSYGLRLPEPSMWLLAGPTACAIFTPWLKKLHAIAASFTVVGALDPDPTNPLGITSAMPPAHGHGGTLTIHTLTAVQSLTIDPGTGRITEIGLSRLVSSPSIHRSEPAEQPSTPFEPMAVPGDIILALPPSALADLVTPAIAARAPDLPNVHYLATEPMISLDLFFRRKLENIPRGITVLLDSPYQMSFLDTSQTWVARADDLPGTSLNVVASNADTLVPPTYADSDIIEALVTELQRYLDFEIDDLLTCRTHLQTNVGEELFVNQVGSWDWRPQATCGISNLFIAGDFCQTAIDVVTIEGAVVSGLMAAEALRRRHRQGPPIRIRQPDEFPALAKTALAAATRPFAYAANVIATTDRAIKHRYAHWFPNG